MCGITGYLTSSAYQIASTWKQALPSACDRLAHRGPDDSGIWLDDANGIGLGHRRLSIVDLSPMGHQPMHSQSGRYVISLNGEIYNFQDIKKVLEHNGCSFRSNSDTEVLLAGFETWGLSYTIQQSIGMFAFAVWDCQEHILHLVRDRVGVKPLYYGWLGSGWAFASELKALKVMPGFTGSIRRESLTLLLRLGYIPAPFSIYEQVNKLLPGTILSIRADSLQTITEPIAYWSIQKVVEQGLNTPFMGSFDDAIQEYDSLLRDSVRKRMIADVPLGAFLSGGINFSLVVAVMQAQNNLPIKTFTIGFAESNYNEAVFARAVAHHIGTEHTELYITPKQAMDVIPSLPILYDEPFGDSSQIPTFLVSQLARRSVTVSLSGDGGDELFWGYTRYPATKRVWETFRHFPPFLRFFMREATQVFSNPLIALMTNRIATRMLHDNGKELLSDKFLKLGEILDFQNDEMLYLKVISYWQAPNLLVPGTKSIPFQKSNLRAIEQLDLDHKMMFFDQTNYLPDDIMVKVDRASMGVSLEAREPLLDHRLIEFTWRLPFHYKYHNGQQKWLLKQLLNHYVPQSLVERQKSGFGVPVDEWLRDPLKGWAEGLLDTQVLQAGGYFNAEPIRKIWQNHLSRRVNASYNLWPILMFQAWLQQQ